MGLVLEGSVLFRYKTARKGPVAVGTGPLRCYR